jgi:hypothetical protein
VSELEPVSGKIVPAPPAAEMRYEDEDPDAVARVFIRVEYVDGRIREYQAKEPQDFEVKESMAMRESPFRVSAGGLFTAMKQAVPSLRLSFTAHPRWNMHIRTEATAPADFPGITY